MISGTVTIQQPFGFNSAEVVQIAAASLKDFGQQGAEAIRAFARLHGISPLAVDYSITKH